MKTWQAERDAECARRWGNDKDSRFMHSFDEGADWALQSSVVKDLRDASDEMLFALQSMIIQFNGSVPGLTPQQVFDGAMAARNKYRRLREAFDRATQGGADD